MSVNVNLWAEALFFKHDNLQGSVCHLSGDPTLFSFSGKTMSLALLIQHAESGQGLVTNVLPYAKSMQIVKGAGFPEGWEKRASETLVFADPDSMIGKCYDVKDFKDLGDDASEIPEKSIHAFDAILTKAGVDRDGDRLHPDGMKVVESHPLLWQHNWSQPIGCLVKVLDQNKELVACRYAIADTEVGRDAKALLEVGGLSMSHGFLPLPGAVTPIYADGKSKEVTGFEIKSYETFESSLVSVPANASAQVLANYSKQVDAILEKRPQFESSVFRSYANAINENRTKTFSGVDIPTLDKSLSYAVDRHLVGSYEHIQDEVHKYLSEKLYEEHDGGWVFMVATFDGEAVVCHEKYSRGEYVKTCYTASWSFDDGKVVVGDHAEVEINTEIVAKSLELHIQDRPSVEPVVEKDLVDVQRDPILSLFGVKY